MNKTCPSPVSTVYTLEDPADGVQLRFWQNQESGLFSIYFECAGGVRYLNFSFDGGVGGTGEYAEVGVPANKEIRVPLEVAREIWRMLTLYSPEKKSWRRSA